jgi:hypothetical protein
VAIKALFIGGRGPSAPIFAIIFPFRFHARHWLWIRLGLKAAVGQTITRTTDEANLFIRLINDECFM